MWVSGEPRGSQEDLVLHPGARLLLGLWLDLKGERPAPARADLELRQLRRQAPWLFILEPSGEANGFTYRLAGTAMCAFLKSEKTGANFLSDWGRPQAGAISRALGAVTARLQPAHFRLRYLTDQGQKIGADMLALPITARDGHSMHVLGGLFPHGSPDIWHYDSLTPSDLVGVRLFNGKADDLPARVPVQETPRLRLIPGGLGRH